MFRFLIPVSVLVASLQTSCGVESTSHLSLNPFANDKNAEVVRYVSSDRLFHHVYVVQGKGYELRCDDKLELVKLIASTGFPAELLGSTPVYAEDAPEILALNLNQQPRLECQSPSKKVYKTSIEGKTQYFFSDSGFEKNRLFGIGCKELADVMKLKFDEARSIEAWQIEDGVFTASDADNVNCLKGSETAPVTSKPAVVPPAEVSSDFHQINAMPGITESVIWESNSKTLSSMMMKAEIKPFLIRAKDRDNRFFTVSLSERKGLNCDKILVTQKSEEVEIQGSVDPKSNCEITLEARRGGSVHSRHTVKIKMHVPPPRPCANLTGDAEAKCWTDLWNSELKPFEIPKEDLRVFQIRH